MISNILNKKSRATQVRSISQVSKKISRIDYNIPERYVNAFYLANAAFFDSTNWFLHKAYEVVFPTLTNTYRSTFQDQNFSDLKIHEKLENVVEILDQCNSVIDVRFPVSRENGRLEIIRGFRAHYGEAVRQTPCLGGLRIDEDITRDQMKALSVLSSMKNSCIGIGLSGAHGGIKINPKEYTAKELKNIIDLYVTELYRKGYSGYRDIMHPDINTSEREMKWVTKAFDRCSGQNINAAAMGKPLNYGGIEGYEKSAAMGCLKSLEIFLNNEALIKLSGLTDTGLENKKFIIQGLGKVGKPLGLLLLDKGAICVGVKEQEAYLYDPKGIDLKQLYEHREKNGTMATFGLAKTQSLDSILTEDCDILVLAACHKSLVCYVARDVKAKVILEASDGPVTPAAHKILTTKSKLVIPDIYACAGSTIASYFEYLKNLQQMGLSEELVLDFSKDVYVNIFKGMIQDNHMSRAVGGGQIENIENALMPIIDNKFIKNAIDRVYSDIGQEMLENLTTYKLGVDLRTAAYAVAIKNMFKAIFEQKRLL